MALAIIAAVWLKFALAFDAPDQFLRQKGELAGVEVEPAEGDGLYSAYHVKLASSAGYGVRGHLRVPRVPGRWPSLIVIGGTNTGRMAAELVNPATPYVVLGLDYPWDGPTQLTWWQFLVRVLAVRRAMLLTPSAVMLGVDYLETRPEVDTDRIGVIGHSLGGQEATWLTWFDHRIKAGASSCGFSMIQAILDHQINHNMALYVPGFLKLGDSLIPLLSFEMGHSSLKMRLGSNRSGRGSGWDRGSRSRRR